MFIKKNYFIAAIVTLLLFTVVHRISFAQTPTQCDPVGNVNCDSKVDSGDIVSWLRNYLTDLYAADLNKDGKVTAIDFGIILKGLIPTTIPSPVSGIIANLTDQSTDEYVSAKNLGTGNPQYVDATFTYSVLPSYLLGGEYIQTANADKSATADPLMSFKVNTNSSVYVAFDNRNTTIPTWLSSYTRTSDTVKTDNGVSFNLYKKDFAQGTTVTLGPNANSNRMYSVIVDSTSATIATPTTGTNPSPTNSTPSKTPTPSLTKSPTPLATKTPTPTGPSNTPVPTISGDRITTTKNFKVAFIGDSNRSTDFQAVLTLIKNKGAQLVIHAGDKAYSYGSEKDWMNVIDSKLGTSFPYIGSIGNHDDLTWGDITKGCVNQTSNYTYANFYRCRMQALGITPTFSSTIRDEQADESPLEGNYGTGVYATYSTDYNGLKMVFTGEQTDSTNYNYYNNFINQALTNDKHIWKICNWHKPNKLYTVGLHTGGDTYNLEESCRKLGAIIATGHNHNYSRTKSITLFNSTSPGIDSSRGPDDLRVIPGETFAFVAGTGGGGLYSFTDCSGEYPYSGSAVGCNKGAFGSVYGPPQVSLNLVNDDGQTLSNDDGHGALFITFYVNDDPYQATGEFFTYDKTDKLNPAKYMEVDRFTITAK